MLRARISILTCLTIITVCLRTTYADDTNLSRRLETQQTILLQIEADLVRARDEAREIRDTEQDAAKRYVDARNRVSLIEHSLNQLIQGESLLNADIAEVNRQRSEISRKVAERSAVMERRVRTLYTQGRRQPYQRALLASSLSHWMAARQYMATLNRRDHIDVRHLVEDRMRLDTLATLYRKQRTTLDTLIARRTEQREELVAARSEAERFLAQVQRDRQLAEQAANELEGQRRTSQERVSDYLRQLEAIGTHTRDDAAYGGVSVVTPVDFHTEKGRLPWPVDGPVVGRFGRQRDAETRTWTRNRGIDIGAPKGTNVRAVAAGRVVLVDWFRGYGTFVIVAHGQNYYTLYAYLDAVHVRPDDRVRQGQVVGTSGSEDHSATGAIHFELLAGHEALNPLDWLVPTTQNAS